MHTATTDRVGKSNDEDCRSPPVTFEPPYDPVAGCTTNHVGKITPSGGETVAVFVASKKDCREF